MVAPRGRIDPSHGTPIGISEIPPAAASTRVAWFAGVDPMDEPQLVPDRATGLKDNASWLFAVAFERFVLGAGAPKTYWPSRNPLAFSGVGRCWEN